MKKNITINLFGTLYAIDEDAYQLLERYIENMKSYFAKKEGGEEIADDIEHRVAEHLWDLKEQGMEAVNIETIKDIITRIGNPEDINGDEVGEVENEEIIPDADDDQGVDVPDFKGKAWFTYVFRFNKWLNARGLYRDQQNKVIGGVAAGFSHFFGLFSPLVWRILFLILPFLTSGWFILVYIVLWILVPLAKTAEQRLHMKGKLITPQSINEEIINSIESDKQSSTVVASGCLITLLKGVLLLIAIACLMLVVFALVPLCIFTYDVTEITTWLNEPAIEYAVCNYPQIGAYAWGVAVCALVFTLVPVLAMIHKMRKNERTMPSGVKVGAVVAWCISIVVGIATLVGFDKSMSTAVDKYNDIEDEEYVAKNTREGVFLEEMSWNFLESRNMKLIDFRNGESNLLGRSHPLGLSHEYLRLVQDDRNKEFVAHVEATQSVDAGSYTFEALVWNSGDANRIYIVPQGLDTVVIGFTPSEDGLPLNGRKLADITWEQSRTVPMLAQVADSTEWEHCRTKHGQWQYISREFKHDGGEVKVGIKVGTQNEFASENERTFLGLCMKVK